jgi:hypothetical protein
VAAWEDGVPESRSLEMYGSAPDITPAQSSRTREPLNALHVSRACLVCAYRSLANDETRTCVVSEQETTQAADCQHHSTLAEPLPWTAHVIQVFRDILQGTNFVFMTRIARMHLFGRKLDARKT